MQLIKTVLSSLLVTAVVAAPTNLIIRTDLTDPVNPDSPHLSSEQQCTYVTEYAAIHRYNVVIANAKAFTKGSCGSGFLDNLHGQGCTVTQWGCNYADDSTTDYMEANFQTDLGCDGGDVGTAIWKAFGHLDGVTCQDYTGGPDDGTPPPVDLPVLE